MDYRITDSHACPPGMMDAYHTESVVRLPDSQWCFQPPYGYAAAREMPIRSSGRFTFASVHRLPKITPLTIRLWSQVLHAVPGSVLLIVSPGLEERTTADMLRRRFEECRIPPDRLELLGAQSFGDYLTLHQRIDINLDTAPYTGGTTTCHSLWMGVPLISYAGRTATSRGGASLLKVMELSDLVADSSEEYVAIAVNLARDSERLNVLRASLRDRMAESPLTDGKLFTAHLEDVYRTMWETWCQEH
jgi:predicted O-linked N-acetylglucosamine transferase (SPINDLY family)